MKLIAKIVLERVRDNASRSSHAVSRALGKGRFRRRIKLPIGADQLVKGESAISSAWIGQNPYRRPPECGRLSAPCNIPLMDQRAISRLAEKTDETRRIAPDLFSNCAAVRVNSSAES